MSWPKRGVEYASLCRGDGEKHGFVFACTVRVRVGVRSREHGHVFGRPAQAVVKLVFRVHPFCWQALGDRVFRCRGRDDWKACRLPWLPALPGLWSRMTLPSRKRTYGPDFFAAVRPSHRSRSSRCMRAIRGKRCQPRGRKRTRRRLGRILRTLSVWPTTTSPCRERLCSLRPHIVGRKIRPKAAHIGTLRRRGGNIDCEDPRLL